MPAPEIIAAKQALTDTQSAFDTLQQNFADSLGQKNTQLADKDTQITGLQGEIVTKDTRIAELEAQVGSGIDPADVNALTTDIQALTTDIASTPTT